MILAINVEFTEREIELLKKFDSEAEYIDDKIYNGYWNEANSLTDKGLITEFIGMTTASGECLTEIGRIIVREIIKIDKLNNNN